MMSQGTPGDDGDGHVPLWIVVATVLAGNRVPLRREAAIRTWQFVGVLVGVLVLTLIVYVLTR
jgi:multisubunit Na+/H+ antiporter MnhC subunit